MEKLRKKNITLKELWCRVSGIFSHFSSLFSLLEAFSELCLLQKDPCELWWSAASCCRKQNNDYTIVNLKIVKKSGDYRHTKPIAILLLIVCNNTFICCAALRYLFAVNQLTTTGRNRSVSEEMIPHNMSPYRRYCHMCDFLFRVSVWAGAAGKM